MDVLETIGDNLAALIKSSGYRTAEQFAHENGFSKGFVSKLIRGKTSPRIDTLIRIADALGASLNDLYPPRRQGKGPAKKP